MKTYDVIVIGSGSGLTFVDNALAKGLSVALVDKGPLGGTCLNVGCIPSKLLLYPADVIRMIEESKKLGISAQIKSIDHQKILDHMKKTVSLAQSKIRKNLKESQCDYYHGYGEFVDKNTIRVNGKSIRAKRIFIASGTRPSVPPIAGLDKVMYLTSDSVFSIKTIPKSLVIIGGGYIGIEFCHFFSAMGTKVTVLQRDDYIVSGEDKEICSELRRQLEQHMDILSGFSVESVQKSGNGIRVSGTHHNKKKSVSAQMILVATGRVSNADKLDAVNAGLDLDKRGFIKTDAYLQTNVKHIYCIGDANAKAPFKHAANYEADIAWHNAFSKKKRRARYDTVPHAIFTYPQVAGIGLTQEQAVSKFGKANVTVSKVPYSKIAKGVAMKEDRGFAKAIFDKKSKLIGFHIIGPEASVLIQEVINRMAGKDAMVIHPSLSELVKKTLGEQ